MIVEFIWVIISVILSVIVTLLLITLFAFIYSYYVDWKAKRDFKKRQERYKRMF